MNKLEANKSNRQLFFLLTVASLGYFVDIYDLVLFGVVKAESLTQIMKGASEQTIAATGKFLFNVQMIGMLIGGVLWGVLGDKRGRLKVLFGSILLYSSANIANAFVTDVNTYTFIRLIAGIGLAGELGAGITLISEVMSKEKRGYGTMLVVTFGALGAVVASLVGAKGTGIADMLFQLFKVHFANWQVAYLVGGAMGFILLLLRVGTLESSFFIAAKEQTTLRKGSFKVLLGSKENRLKYLYCVLIGVPIWFVIGLLVMNSKDNFGPLVGLKNVVNGKAVMYAYIGLSFGDLLSGILSQVLKSRKKVVKLYLIFTALVTLYFLVVLESCTLETYYFMCFLLGTGAGYWAIFVTIAAEQFGTNVRSTAANTIPNFVRGTVPLITLLFSLLLAQGFNDASSALIVGFFFLFVAFFSISQLKESFGKSLDYSEGA